MKKMILEIAFIVIIVIGLVFLSKSDNKFDDELRSSGVLAIGSFVRFNIQLVGYSKSYEFYYYNANKQKLTEVNSVNMPNKDSRKKIRKGENFLVLYNSNGARMLFDYPIKDSTDFKRYVEKFEQQRKK